MTYTDKRVQPPEYYAEMDERMLEALRKNRICTTEDLRVAACDTRQVVYSRLRALERAGKIESNKPRHGVQKKWRIPRA